MPIYEYRCHQCGNEFERVVFGGHENLACPHCESTDIQKLMSVCAFSVGSTFKGTGSSACSACNAPATGCSSCHVKH